MTDQKNHERLSEVVESVAEKSEHIEAVEYQQDHFEILVADDADAIERAVQEIDASEVGDSEYEVDVPPTSPEDSGDVRVVSPSLREIEQEVTDTINRFLGE